MKVTRNCNLETFYKGMSYWPVSLNRDFLFKLDPAFENLPYKRSKKYYIEKIKLINPSRSKLWKIRDELFQEKILSIGNELKEIQTAIAELKK